MSDLSYSQVGTFRSSLDELQSNIVIALFACAAGFANVTLILGIDRIDPLNLTWLQGDPAQYQIAWEFLRRDGSWTLPLTWVSDLGYPLGEAAAYLDVIPIVAVPLRLLSTWLPTEFQYLGLYAVACHALQAFFGFKLVARFTDDRVVAVVGSLFLLVAPVLTWRLLGHYSLCSQWLILAGLSYYFSPAIGSGFTAYMRPLVVLCVAAGAIHPYIALFAIAIAGAAILRCCLERKISLVTAIGGSAVVSGAALLAFYVVGFLSVDGPGELVGGGYGDFSMNLFAPLNPDRFSAIGLPPLPTFPFQYEGYNYLGPGIIALLMAALVLKPRAAAGLVKPSVLPLVLVCCVFTALALSTKITAGQQVLAEFPLPGKIVAVLAIFRASGRLFWIVHYLIVLLAVVGVCLAITNRWGMRAVLVAALALQIVDILPLRREVFAATNVSRRSPLQAADWARLPQRHRHLVVLPAWQCGPQGAPGGSEAWYWFALLAARGDMTVNSFYSARMSPDAAWHYCQAMPDALSVEGPSDDSAIVADDANTLMIALRAGNRHHCRKVDGFNLCTFDPGPAARAREDLKSMVPRYAVGTRVGVAGAAKDAILSGLEAGTAPVRWSTSGQVRIYVRPEFTGAGRLRLEVDVGQALVNGSHPLQRAIVKVNGSELGTWTFRTTSSAMRAIEIPPGLLKRGEIAAIELALPDAVAPCKIGAGDDCRTLALSFKSFVIVDGGT